jgi:hypothetical protein
MYIKNSAAISCQNSFRNKGYSNTLVKDISDYSPISPDYKEFVTAGQMRRLSPVLRASIACAMACKDDNEWESIIVGTGIGCIKDTVKFLDDVNLSKSDSLIPPTAFIQSTHNTISGQISILTGNHNYNITHSHRFFSFENALLDAKQQILDGAKNALVGASEETLPLLDELCEIVNPIWKNKIATSAAYFQIEKLPTSKVKIESIACLYNQKLDYHDAIQILCKKNDINFEEIDIVLNAALSKTIDHKGVKNLSDIYGYGFSLSALGMHLAEDILLSQKNIKNILVVNSYGNNCSLIHVKHVEA